MSNSLSSRMHFTRGERIIAVLYGSLCHVLFAAGVGAMAVGLYTGMQIGLLHLPHRMAAAWNSMLLLQFPVIHSFLLSDRGRGWLDRLAPVRLARELRTTLFAITASLQLLLVFLLWSPSGHMYWQPQGWLAVVLTVAYAAGWLLLLRSMYEAGLGVQTGSLGWMSVARNRRPVYPPLARRGLHGLVRQPIYLSFSLILWTAPVWTLDRVVITGLWTVYCVVAPLLKERRMHRIYGETFRRYRAVTPYWLPGLNGTRVPRRHSPSCSGPELTRRIVIAGAGPVGMMLANLLGRAGVPCTIFERRRDPDNRSMAIGVMPPSLSIFQRFGRADDLIARGIPVREAHVHDGRRHLGSLSFRELDSEYPFVLSVPQHETASLLHESLRAAGPVTLISGVQADICSNGPERIVPSLHDEQGNRMLHEASLVIGCDGHRSAVRHTSGIRMHESAFRQRFVMGDFPDETGFGSDVHLFFTESGSVESFPLPGGMRRWVVLAGAAEATAQTVCERVSQRTGLALDAAGAKNVSGFGIRRALVERYVSGRVVLCGDAAHVMSPIGGQGMNTGFGDAELLAEVLVALHEDRIAPSEAFAFYEAVRRKAFRTAARRAEWGMRLGTLTGRWPSAIRSRLIEQCLLKGPVEKMLPAWFSMLSIPRISLSNEGAHG